MVKAVQNGGTFHTFREEEIGELLPKNIARAANPDRRVDNFHLKNLCGTKCFFRLNVPYNRQMKTEIIYKT